MNKPLSSKANSNSPVWILTLVGLFGFVLFFFFSIRPVFEILLARSWVVTPCIVDSSTVKRHPGSKNSTYSIEIVYSYEVGGKKFTGNRYHFMGGSTSSYRGKAAIVRGYPPGKRAVCYVNPRDPSDSVIERGFTSDMWVGIIPLLFVVFPWWGAITFRRAARRPAGARWQPPVLRHAADFNAASAGPVELKPTASPLTSFSILLAMALFWNGITMTFVFTMWKGAHFPHGDWGSSLFSGGQMLFMVPFVLVGLVLIVVTGSLFLALFNPRIHLKVNPGSVALGDSFSLEWKIEGRADKLSQFSIVLEGREEAVYQSGKNTSTSKETFSRIEILTTPDRANFAYGTARVAVPRDSMHSLDTGHNKITWVLVVLGTIPRWPDIKEEYPLPVLPMRKGAAA